MSAEVLEVGATSNNFGRAERERAFDRHPIEAHAELLTSLNKTARDGILSVRTADFEKLTGHKPKSLRDVFDENRTKLLIPAER